MGICHAGTWVHALPLRCTAPMLRCASKLASNCQRAGLNPAVRADCCPSHRPLPPAVQQNVTINGTTWNLGQVVNGVLYGVMNSSMVQNSVGSIIQTVCPGGWVGGRVRGAGGRAGQGCACVRLKEVQPLGQPCSFGRQARAAARSGWWRASTGIWRRAWGSVGV